jgi:hypothetical protein
MLALKLIITLLGIYLLLGIFQLIFEIKSGIFNEIIEEIMKEEDDKSKINKLKYQFAGVITTIMYWYEAYKK